MKKTLSLLLVAMMLLSGLVVTASAEGAGDRRKVVFWHCFGGSIGEAVQAVIDGFNESQDEIFVEGIFQGAYDEALTKLKTDIPQGTGPDMWQMFELGTTFLVSSGYAIPFQEMLDKDPYISIDDIEPALRRYYTYDDKMVCIPFNPSTPLMYYNKTAFDAAGITEIPTTFAEIAAVADKLAVKEGNRVTRYPMGLSIYGWFFENFLAGMGANYVNNDNGRTGVPTAIEFDSNGAGKQVMETWKQLVDDEVIYNYGANNDAARAGFIAEQTCITLESTAQLTSLLNAIDGKFELGTAYLPSMLDKSENGVIIGGANLWLAKQDDEQRVADAWEFIKYATSAEVASSFSLNTGYFCANMKAYEQPEYQAYLEENPNFLTAINQLHDCPDNYATNGASVGVMPELRAIFQAEMELVLEEVNSIDDAIANMAKAGNAAIENYNATTGN